MVLGHPTASRLLSSAVDVLDCTAPADVTAHMVLALAGASKGSMYHHYRDFDDLMDRACVARFEAAIDSSIADLGPTGGGCPDRRSVPAGADRAGSGDAGASNPLARRERAWALGRLDHAGMRELLGVQQQRLTDAIAGAVHDGQTRGWFRTSLDPHVVAVFLQACSLGQILGEVTSRPISEDAWNDLIALVVHDSLLVDD